MNVSQFDGSAAFYGGGFMAPSANPTPEQSFFPSKNRDIQTLLPLTVKQISNAIAGENGKSEFSIDGVDVNTVKIVGIVQENVGRITEVAFTLDDGTGRVECNRWCQDQTDTAEMEVISNGMYVRVHGRLKSFQGKKFIHVFSIRDSKVQQYGAVVFGREDDNPNLRESYVKAVDDYNEIASHFIECMYVHFYSSLPKPHIGVNVTAQPHMTIPPNQLPAQYSLDGQRSTEERVLQLLSLPSYLSSVQGAHIDDIARQLKISVHDVMYAVQNLAGESKVYSTIDDSHFKSTANG